jgi:hypothetical protein
MKNNYAMIFTIIITIIILFVKPNNTYLLNIHIDDKFDHESSRVML